MREVAATSWVDSAGNNHIRVYATNEDGDVSERCWDGDGWYDGIYSGQGQHVAATSWVENGVHHLRVYTADSSGNISEQGWDAGDDASWYVGAYSGQGRSVAATAWLEADGLRLRVYSVGDDGQITEQCWDAPSANWFVGDYSG